MKSRTLSTRSERVSQGDLYRDIEYLEYATQKRDILEISRVRYPLAVVLTQDCDLQQASKHDQRTGAPHNDDKRMLSVLVAPAYNAEHFRDGKHLSELGMTMQQIAWNKTQGKDIRNNSNPRYHYLEFEASVPLVPVVVDFKHYFSVDVAYLKKSRSRSRVCRLAPLYREDITQRFSAFLSRVGLPDPVTQQPTVA